MYTPKNINLFLFTLSILLMAMGCDKVDKKKEDQPVKINTETSVKYAKGFDIQLYDGYKKLIIKSPYPDAKQYQEFILVSDPHFDFEGKNKIDVPVNKIVATSTTHIPMMEILDQVQSLIGFPTTDYISSAQTRKRIDNGLVTDLGNEQDFNTEVLISLQPNAVIAFSMGSSTKHFTTIEKNGIPVIYNGDWLEATPLGRAEWIKFFGALFDMDKEADSIFNRIESKYLKAKKLAEESSFKPSVLSGVLFKDQWNLPAGESFTAQLFRDANTDYIWNDSSGQGSLVLSFETVFEKAQDADFWIGSGYYTSFEELGNANSHYRQFKSFKEKKVFSFSKRRNENGGVLYFELAPLQPDVVLMDLIKVAHPKLLPDYEPFFLQELD